MDTFQSQLYVTSSFINLDRLHHKETASGCPITIERLGHVDTDALTANMQFEQFSAWQRDRVEWQYSLFNRLSLEHNRVIGSVRIIDLDGLSRKTLSLRAWSNHAVQIAQTHYPEQLSKAIIINAPWIFSIAWAFTKPFLAVRTLGKIIVLGSDYRETIAQHVDPAFLPEWAGGTCVSCAGGCVRDLRESNPPLSVTVGAGSVHDIGVDVAEAGSVVSWSFCVVDYDIDYSVHFAPADGDARELSSGTALAKKYEAGSFEAPSAGHFTIHLNNYKAWVYSKTIEYRIEAIKMSEVKELKE